MKQVFYCKKCKEEFTVNEKEFYWNYKCPKCESISTQKDYIGPRFKGLDTIES
jgi:Zn finger protein HypA/HybF involved in hydrogenase expression